jgi:hypothetical protein
VPQVSLLRPGILLVEANLVPCHVSRETTHASDSAVQESTPRLRVRFGDLLHRRFEGCMTFLRTSDSCHDETTVAANADGKQQGHDAFLAFSAGPLEANRTHREVPCQRSRRACAEEGNRRFWQEVVRRWGR